jgi:hypothetical protein
MLVFWAVTPYGRIGRQIPAFQEVHAVFIFWASALKVNTALEPKRPISIYLMPSVSQVKSIKIHGLFTYLQVFICPSKCVVYKRLYCILFLCIAHYDTVILLVPRNSAVCCSRSLCGMTMAGQQSDIPNNSLTLHSVWKAAS